MPSKAVLLFDESAFHQHDLNYEDILQNILTCLRVVCVRLLTGLNDYSTDFVFGFKFYNSLGDIVQNMKRYNFCDVNPVSFETLENKLQSFYEQSSLRFPMAESVSSTLKETVPYAKILNKALTEVLCDFDWSCSDLCSPIRNRKQSENDNFINHLVFLFSYSPSNYCLKNSTKIENSLSVPALQNLLMPPALKKKFVDDSCIRLVWVDTVDVFNKCSKVAVEDIETQKKLFTAINNFNGTYVSLRVLMQTSIINPVSSALNNDETHLLDPFSIILSSIIRRTRDLKVSPCKSCRLSFSNDEQLELLLHPMNSTDSSGQCTLQPKIIQPKKFQFTSQKVIEPRFYGLPLDTYLISPSETCTAADNSATFSKILKSLTISNKFLCIKSDDSPESGILCPLSPFSAILTIHDTVSAVPNNATVPSSDDRENALLLGELIDIETKENSYILQNCPIFVNGGSQGTMMSSQNFAAHMLSQKCPTVSDSKEEEEEPSSEILFESPNKAYQCLESFLKKLQHHQSAEKEIPNEMSSPVQSSPRQSSKRRRSSPGCSRVSKLRKNYSGNKSHQVPPVTSQTRKELIHTISESDCQNEEKIIQHLTDMYNKCIESEKDVRQTGEMILGDTFIFFKAKGSDIDKADIQKFLDEHIFKSWKSIQEKYYGKDDAQSMAMKVKEFQLQTILNLEFEVAFPSSSPSSCIKTVTAHLRGLSFVSGPGELIKFLQEHIKEQYVQDLHHVVVEIGEELNVPLVNEPCSPSSPSDFGSPGQISRSSASPCSSLTACRSSSGIASQIDEVSKRRTIARHASFSGNSQRRQIMIPKELLRKQKPVRPVTDITFLRRSPRFRQTREVRKFSNPPTTKSVRRNLFNVESRASKSPKKKLQMGETSARKKLFRSKSHQSFKKTIVPDTPSPKQGKSALRRRQARIQQRLTAKNAVQEIAESPVTTKTNGGYTKQSADSNKKILWMGKRYKT